MQIDWEECYVWFADKKIKLNISCERLCYSCAPFVICFQKQNTQSFIEESKIQVQNKKSIAFYTKRLNNKLLTYIVKKLTICCHNDKLIKILEVILL